MLIEDENNLDVEMSDNELNDEQENSRKSELESMFKDIDHLNEPSCIDNILMSLEEIRDEDHLFMELLVERVSREEITWYQPWYQQSNSLTRPLKCSEKQKNAEPFLTDTISKAESDRIKKNWRKFMKKYKVPDQLISLARWKNKGKSRLPNTPEEQAKRFVVAYLSRGLERTLYQVFRHIVTYYGSPNKGPYTPEEEKIMEVCFEYHPNHAVTLLSSVLKREPRGIYKRLQQQLNVKPDIKKMKWTLPLATKFLKLLLKYTDLPLEKLKNRSIEKSVFVKLAEKFEHNYTHLRLFWYQSLHVQLFVEEHIKLNKLRKRAFKKLRDSSYQVWTDIRWKDFVTQFPEGLTHRFLYIVCRRVVCSIPDYLKLPLQDLTEQALQKIRKTRYRKLRLKRLCLNEDGDLVKISSTDW
ncbi:unnamed protein product [Chrysodeixis includens]|uniref:Uncharacterized protein n=1 Tax=Chrysodeixis includens TaxID=689277 RepID=A0A9P0BTN5_CHRIL|nr:unnamed protein product [Chrysodeixis includens]